MRRATWDVLLRLIDEMECQVGNRHCSSTSNVFQDENIGAFLSESGLFIVFSRHDELVVDKTIFLYLNRRRTVISSMLKAFSIYCRANGNPSHFSKHARATLQQPAGHAVFGWGLLQ